MTKDLFEKRMEHLKKSYEQMPSHRSKRAVIKKLKKQQRRPKFQFRPIAYVASILVVFFISGVLVASSGLFESQQSANPTPPGEKGLASQGADKNNTSAEHQQGELEKSNQDTPGNHGGNDSAGTSRKSPEEEGGSNSTHEDSGSNSSNGKKADNKGSSDTGQRSSKSSKTHSPKAVIQKAMQALDTSVPKVSPTMVPMDEGKYLTALTQSSTDSYKVDLFQTSKPVPVNDSSLEYTGSNQKIGVFGASLYGSEAEAKKKVRFFKVKNGKLKLSSDITARVEGTAGHAHISWNEGRWLMKVNSPSNPSDVYKGYGSNKQVAKKMVAYLEEHYLPAPDRHGVIKVNLSKKSPEITIRWQEGKTIHYVKTQQSPIAGLKMVVEN